MLCFMDSLVSIRAHLEVSAAFFAEGFVYLCFILDAWLFVSSKEAMSYPDMAAEFTWNGIL